MATRRWPSSGATRGRWPSRPGQITFLTDPEAYIGGAKDLIVEGVAGPATEVGRVAAQNTNWTALGLVGIGVFGAVAAWKTWLRRPKTGTA